MVSDRGCLAHIRKRDRAGAYMNKDHLARQPNPVDLHVGMRIRARRKSLGLSQDKLAMALGLTFQQVQKYERGANRISASKLYEAARILGVPIPFFFEGLPVLVDDDAAHSAGQGLGDAFTRFMATQGALELAELFPRISNAKIRRHVVGMCKAMADVGDQNAKVA